MQSSIPEQPLTLKEAFSRRAVIYHGKVPLIRKLPVAAVGIILAVAFANAVAWAAVGVVLVSPSGRSDG